MLGEYGWRLHRNTTPKPQTAGAHLGYCDTKLIREMEFQRLPFSPLPPPPSPTSCRFAILWSPLKLLWQPQGTPSHNQRLHMRRPEVPKRKGEGEKSYKKKIYLAYLVTLGSVWKVKCFMFRNTWADSCCPSSCLINFSYFSSSSEASVIPSVNLWNKY